MRIIIEYNRDDLNRIQYPVIVEGWNKIKSGRIHRAFEAEFSEKERVTLSRFYPILRRWYLEKGTPEKAQIGVQTYNLLIRAANFFGTI